jgi:hypothetical protein
MQHTHDQRYDSRRCDERYDAAKYNEEYPVEPEEIQIERYYFQYFVPFFKPTGAHKQRTASESRVMSKGTLVALDSNCYSYLLDALEAGEEPKADDKLRVQKQALVRTMLYDEWGLYLPTEVVKECGNIPNQKRAALHKSWQVLFTEIQPINPSHIDTRANELLRLHKGDKDCRIVAECEDTGILVLLTYDGTFISKLGGNTHVRVVRPSEYWTGLNIAQGTEPKTLPGNGNPLEQARWWRWE